MIRKVEHWPSKMLVAAKMAGGPATKRPTNVALVCASINLCLVFQLIKLTRLIKSTAIVSNVDSPTYDGMVPQHASKRQTEQRKHDCDPSRNDQLRP